MPPRESLTENDTTWSNREAMAALEQSFPNVESREKKKAMTVRVGGASWTALDRISEDRYQCRSDGTGVVVDGVGSKDNSIPAADMVKRELIDALVSADATHPEELEQTIAAKIRDVHEQTLQLAADAGHSMAAAAALIKPLEFEGKNYVFIASIGDAPVYMLRDGELSELTDLHTNLPPNKDDRPALGKPDRPIPKTFIIEVKNKDTFIIATNGIRKNDPNMSTMQKVLEQYPDPGVAAERLVTARPKHSLDSRTAIVLTFRKVKNKQDALD